ncbi:hypothetical protein THOD04_310008 [Vibrio owensii]|nr:hypothetical protein THOD04_310008 [Vibrio owensii]
MGALVWGNSTNIKDGWVTFKSKGACGLKLNKLFKSDSQRVAFLLCVDFSV